MVQLLNIPRWQAASPGQIGGTWRDWCDWRRGRRWLRGKGSDGSVGWDQAAGEYGLRSHFAPAGPEQDRDQAQDPNQAREPIGFSLLHSGIKNRHSWVYTRGERGGWSKGAGKRVIRIRIYVSNLWECRFSEYKSKKCKKYNHLKHLQKEWMNDET